MGKEYDGIHRISFMVNEEGIIEHVFDNFKTSNRDRLSGFTVNTKNKAGQKSGFIFSLTIC